MYSGQSKSLGTFESCHWFNCKWGFAGLGQLAVLVKTKISVIADQPTKNSSGVKELPPQKTALI